jgi:hypothetical protein
VPADGRAEPERIGTHAEDGYAVHAPSLLPDGSGFFVSVRRLDGSQRSWQLIDTRTGASSQVIERASELRFAPPGWLLYGADGLLLAQPFDISARSASGSPQAIADRVDLDVLRAAGNVSHAAGTLIYLQSPPPPMRLLSWHDVDGRTLSTIGSPAPYEDIWASPDGLRAIVALDDSQLWLVDLASGARAPFYAGPGRRGADVEWSPDGREVAFRELAGNLMVVQPIDGRPSRTIGSNDTLSAWAPTSWTPDGRSIVLNLYEGLRGNNIAVVNADGSGTPRRIVATDAQEYLGRVSPDGRWLAYVSDESGSAQAYVTAFPNPGLKTAITTAGAAFIAWLSSAELMIADDSEQLQAVTLRLTTDAVGVAGRRPILRGAAQQRPGSFSRGTGRFLLAPVSGAAADAPSLMLLTNWTQTLRR